MGRNKAALPPEVSKEIDLIVAQFEKDPETIRGFYCSPWVRLIPPRVKIRHPSQIRDAASLRCDLEYAFRRRMQNDKQNEKKAQIRGYESNPSELYRKRRAIIAARVNAGETVFDLANEIGQTPSSIYRILRRVKRSKRDQELVRDIVEQAVQSVRLPLASTLKELDRINKIGPPRS